MTRRDLHLAQSAHEMNIGEPIPEKHNDEDEKWETITTASSETERGDIDPIFSSDADLPPSLSTDIDLTIPPSHQETEARNGKCSIDDFSFPPDDALPEVVVEQYEPGINDIMTGAVDPQDALSTNALGLSFSDDDDVICSSRHRCGYCYDKMPYRVLRRSHLYKLGLPLDDQRHLDLLPVDLLTTFRGVERAWDEFEDIRRQYQDEVREDEEFDPDLNQSLILALAKRGGTSRRQVVYPEDIRPLFPKHEDNEDAQGYEAEDEGAGRDRDAGIDADTEGDARSRRERRSRVRNRVRSQIGFDDEYWRELEDQGAIWDEIYVPRL